MCGRKYLIQQSLVAPLNPAHTRTDTLGVWDRVNQAPFTMNEWAVPIFVIVAESCLGADKDADGKL